MRVAPLVLGLVFLLGACDGSVAQAPPLDPPSVDPTPSESACDTVEVGGATAVRFEVNGSCVPSDDMVLYRCAPADVPVLRISSAEGPAIFLGGPFAVPVRTLPAQVRFAGHRRRDGGLDRRPAPTEPVADDRGPRRRARRPTLTPSPSVASSPSSSRSHSCTSGRRGAPSGGSGSRAGARSRILPRCGSIGDSILDGGRDEVEAALADWALTLDAEVGRSSSSGVELARAAVEQDANAVVIELGTNDASASVFRAHLVETLDILAGVPLVIWQTARGPEEDLSIPEVNAAIRDVVPTYPNVAIADWATFVPDEAVQTDGIHPDEGFQGLEAELLAPMLTEWRDALQREGATTCGRAVLRETA